MALISGQPTRARSAWVPTGTGPTIPDSKTTQSYPASPGKRLDDLTADRIARTAPFGNTPSTRLP